MLQEHEVVDRNLFLKLFLNLNFYFADSMNKKKIIKYKLFTGKFKTSTPFLESEIDATVPINVSSVKKKERKRIQE